MRHGHFINSSNCPHLRISGGGTTYSSTYRGLVKLVDVGRRVQNPLKSAHKLRDDNVATGGSSGGERAESLRGGSARD